VVAAYLFAAAAKIDPSYLPDDANMHPLQKKSEGRGRKGGKKGLKGWGNKRGKERKRKGVRGGKTDG